MQAKSHISHFRLDIKSKFLMIKDKHDWCCDKCLMCSVSFIPHDLWPRKKRWNQGLEGLRYWQNQDLTIGNLISGFTLIIILFVSLCSNINNSVHSQLVVQQKQQIFPLRNPQFNRYSYIWGNFLKLIPIFRGSNTGIIVVCASSSSSYVLLQTFHNTTPSPPHTHHFLICTQSTQYT